MSLRLRTGSALALLSMIGAVPTIAGAQGSPEETMLASVKNGPLAKLGLARQSVRRVRRSPSQGTFESRNPIVKVRGGRVAVNLYAAVARRCRRRSWRLARPMSGRRARWWPRAYRSARSATSPRCRRSPSPSRSSRRSARRRARLSARATPPRAATMRGPPPLRRHRRHRRRALRQLPVQPAGVRAGRTDDDCRPGRRERRCPRQRHRAQ